MTGSIVLFGDLPASAPLRRVADHFGWSLHCATTPNELALLGRHHDVVAVLFSPTRLGDPWRQSLRKIRSAAPAALPIVCYSFAESLPLQEMTEAGAFHSVHLPFSLDEVRQSFGFASVAMRKQVDRRQDLQAASVSSSVA